MLAPRLLGSSSPHVSVVFAALKWQCFMSDVPDVLSSVSRGCVSIVLPVRLSGEDVDLERLVLVNLRSISVFFSRIDLVEIIIIARRVDSAAIARVLATQVFTLPIRFVDEEVLCPCFRTLGGLGWFRQQILKIAVAGFVKSDYLLILDDDCVMTRHAGMKDFMREGKLLKSHIPIEALRNYYKASCEVLRYPFDSFLQGEIIMNVTPEILVRDVLLQMQHEIQSLWGVPDFAAWLLKISREYCDRPSNSLVTRVMARIFESSRKKRAVELAELRSRCGDWSEYSLYWTYLKKHELQHLYVDYSQNADVPQIGDAGVWTNSEARALKLDSWVAKTFGPDQAHYFAVVSAKITELNWKLFIEKVSARLDLA